jgi:quercetin dioxygenase-like cupin family protein
MALSLDVLARDHLAAARESSSGRSAETLYGGRDHTLRQTLVALTAGTRLAEHENPGEATLQVLSGEVWLSSGSESWQGCTNDLLLIPPARHELCAEEDSVVLLTVAKLT